MKKAFFAALATLAAGAAVAAPNAGDKPLEMPTQNVSPYTYSLGVTTHQETYTEYADSAKLMREEALMTGIKGSIERDVVRGLGKLRLTGEFAVGQADYIGSYLGGKYGDVKIQGLSRQLIEVTGQYRQDAPAWNGVALGLGLGYRRLVDNLQEAGPSGYKRINDRIYFSLGLDKTFDFNEWTVTPAVQYKHLLWGEHKSDLVGGITVSQNTGSGSELSVAFQHKGGRYPTTITPYYRTWHLKDSNVQSGFYEPENKTQELGVAVTFQF